MARRLGAKFRNGEGWASWSDLNRAYKYAFAFRHDWKSLAEVQSALADFHTLVQRYNRERLQLSAELPHPLDYTDRSSKPSHSPLEVTSGAVPVKAHFPHRPKSVQVFKRCLPHNYQTTVTRPTPDTTFVISGDIPDLCPVFTDSQLSSFKEVYLLEVVGRKIAY